MKKEEKSKDLLFLLSHPRSFPKANTIVFVEDKLDKNMSTYLSLDLIKSKLPYNIIYINCKKIDILLNIKEDVKIYETFLSSFERSLKLNVLNDSNVLYKQYFNFKGDLKLNDKINITGTLTLENDFKKSENIYHNQKIYLNKNSNLNNNYIFKKYENYDYIFEVSHESGANSKIKLKSLNDKKNKINVIGSLIIEQNKKDIISFEKFESLLLDDKSKVSFTPILKIKSEDVSVNHGSSISQVNEDYITFLLSKGLKKTSAKKLLIKSFLHNCE